MDPYRPRVPPPAGCFVEHDHLVIDGERYSLARVEVEYTARPVTQAIGIGLLGIGNLLGLALLEYARHAPNPPPVEWGIADAIIFVVWGFVGLGGVWGALSTALGWNIFMREHKGDRGSAGPRRVFFKISDPNHPYERARDFKTRREAAELVAQIQRAQRKARVDTTGPRVESDRPAVPEPVDAECDGEETPPSPRPEGSTRR